LFDPSVGGIESVSKLLAERFAAAGNEVHVITQSPGDDIRGMNYKITRRPSIFEVVKLLSWSDLFFQNNISLRSLIPALLLRKKVLVVHQTWLVDTHGQLTWNNRLKRALLPRVTNITISVAIADQISGHSLVIGNPYDETAFRLLPSVARDKSLIFVGRLVSDKGVDLLLRALKRLQSENLRPDLTIVGSGPEQQKLQELTRELALDRQVTFAGQKQGAELAEVLNQHQVLVAPSRWAEPFGVVALEGIACGCVVVGSEKGGLKEAIGPCGLTFVNGDTGALASQLKRLLAEPELQSRLRQHADEHLAKFKSDVVAAAYLRIMQKL
jgi:glycosyltransferase involved in cell wall biosynthesis